MRNDAILHFMAQNMHNQIKEKVCTAVIVFEEGADGFQNETDQRTMMQRNQDSLN